MKKIDTSDYDIVVVGAGLVGAAFALLVAQRMPSSKVLVVERGSGLQAAQDSNTRVVALGGLATGILSELGVLTQLGAEHNHPYQKMFVWDENSPGELKFDVQDIHTNGEHDQSQILGHMIDSIECNRLLQQQLKTSSNIEFLCQASITSVNRKPTARVGSLGQDLVANIEGVDGLKLSVCTPLLIGADGANSWVRKLAKIPVSEYTYGQRGIVAKLSAEVSHQDTAWQRFLTDGPVGVLPLANNQVSIVWSCGTAKAEQLMAMPEQAFCDSLAEALEHRLGELTLLNKRQTFPLRSLQAQRYFADRIALLGDAAHCIHPLAGQGANLGFKDADCLSALLAQEGAPALVKCLAEYQRIRARDNVITDQAMSFLNAAFKFNQPAWTAARGLGMSWVSGSSLLKRVLVQQAMGRIAS